jgi:hypothetical protein
MEDEFTELVDGKFDRVDLVGKAANGVPRFLIAKSAHDQQHGILEASLVRDLISKGEAVTAVAKAGKELDAGEVFADAKGEGDPMQPGSGAWEAVDAATAMKWTAILSRAKNAIQMLAGREEVEGFTGADDGSAAWDLDDAACSIDCAIDILAPYAMGEQAESDMLGEVAKAAEGLEGSGLAVLEGFGPVVKAGRTLSAGNESRIREAVNSLQQVLSSLPAPTEGSMNVAKEGEMLRTSKFITSDINGEVNAPKQDGMGDEMNDDVERKAPTNVTPTTSPDEAVLTGTGEALPGGDKADSTMGNAGAEEKERMTGGVMKADKQLMAVFSQSGKMLGVVDPEKIQMVQTGEDDAPADDPAAAAPEAAAAPAAPEAEASMAVPSEEDPVMKAAVDEVVKAALAQRDEEHSSVVKALEDRLAALEAPAPSRILTNGVRPPSDLRGMTAGGDTVTKSHDDLVADWERTVDVTKRAALETQMNEQAAAALSSLRESQRATR